MLGNLPQCLCGPLCISASSALTLHINAENADTQRTAEKLLRHFGELVGEGVDDELEAIGDAEL